MDKLTLPELLTSLVMAGLLTVVAGGCSSGAPSGDVVPREECPPFDCPAPVAETRASPYKPGDKVEAMWGGTWWAAEVRATNTCGLTKIGFEGYDAASDEWVEAARVRAVGSGEGAPQTQVVIRTYQKEEPVRIEWSGTWYDGKVVEARPPLYKVRYDGYDASADEWVPPSRLDRREGAVESPDPADAIPKDARRVEVEWGGRWYPAFVLESRQDGKSLIRYEGFDKSSDEWVLQRRVRPFRQPSRP